MSLIAPLRAGRQSRRRIAYVLAVFLPALSIGVTEHAAALSVIPYSLHLLAVVVVGILGGWGHRCWRCW